MTMQRIDAVTFLYHGHGTELSIPVHYVLKVVYRSYVIVRHGKPNSVKNVKDLMQIGVSKTKYLNYFVAKLMVYLI